MGPPHRGMWGESWPLHVLPSIVELMSPTLPASWGDLRGSYGAVGEAAIFNCPAKSPARKESQE